jgi:Rieske Fe-S protein
MPRETFWLAPLDRIKVYASLGALAGGLALVIAFIAVFAAFTYPTERTAPSRVFVGFVDGFEVGKPVAYMGGEFYVVKDGEGRFRALYAKDTHPYGCDLRWLPDFAYWGQDGKLTAGWFRDACTHDTFDAYGTRVFGPAPRSLDRFPVEIKGNEVYVRPVRQMLTRGCPYFYC